MDTYTSIAIYLSITVITFIFGLIRTWSFYKVAKNSSMALHKDMYKSVIRAPVLFFNTNPKGNEECPYNTVHRAQRLMSNNKCKNYFVYPGRIINRFSGDMGTVDYGVPEVLLEVIQVLNICTDNSLLWNPFYQIKIQFCVLVSVHCAWQPAGDCDH